MKQNFTHRFIYITAVVLLLVMGLTQCSFTKKNCCGYSGPIVSPAAIALYAKDHFIAKDVIDEWTQRYEVYKASLKNNLLTSNTYNELGDSCSFNGHFVSLLLCNDRSIGIRVLYGMDPQYKVHIILVGIKPDYSTLYILKPGFKFTKPRRTKAIWGINSVYDEMPASFDNIIGGLQFSQKP